MYQCFNAMGLIMKTHLRIKRFNLDLLPCFKDRSTGRLLAPLLAGIITYNVRCWLDALRNWLVEPGMLQHVDT